MTEFSNPYPAETFSDAYSEPAQGTIDTHAAESGAPMQQKAAESLEAGKQAAADVATTAADKAKDVATETRQQARNVLAEAQDQLQSQVGEQHRNLVSTLMSLSDELSVMAVKGEQNGHATELVSQAADRTHGAATWLDSREPSELLDELRRFARQKPGTFVLGALAAGVVAGRLTRGVVAEHSADADAASTTDVPPAESSAGRTSL